MTLARFILSSALVSGSFIVLAVPLLFSSLGTTENIFQKYPLLFLFPLPYFLGASLNKEAYWARSLSLSELLNSRESKKQKGEYGWAVRMLTAVVLGLAVSLPPPPKDTFLLLLGVSWGAVVTRAWFIYQECLTRNSTGRTLRRAG
ncbi:hypothetical protein SVA_1755 [Sulfurifustis variabilis]|uniref:Uncharacterized protein n=1 Tax=Sulfurifustis variabilis TaxID=1675686 RepID=A0A1B4V466_9GAMM|nr:hypothetical protein SVA_1755 [Sulfurifustis variabilis]